MTFFEYEDGDKWTEFEERVEWAEARYFPFKQNDGGPAIRMSVTEGRKNAVTLTAAWEALGRPEQFTLSSGGGALYMRVVSG